MMMAIDHFGIKIMADVIKSQLPDMEVSNPFTADTRGAAIAAKSNYLKKSTNTNNGHGRMSPSM